MLARRLGVHRPAIARTRQNGLARRNKLRPSQALYESIRTFQYAETAAQIIIVVVTVVAIDLLRARIRRTLV
jgi:hypothetical protein